MEKIDWNICSGPLPFPSLLVSHPAKTQTDFFFFLPVPCHLVWHPPIIIWPWFFSLQSFFRYDLNHWTLVNRSVANTEILLSGSTLGTFNAKRNSLRASGSNFLPLGNTTFSQCHYKGFYATPRQDITVWLWNTRKHLEQRQKTDV